MINSFDNQTLYDYLLGTLPDEDIERLDELTFTDPDFADSVNAAEKDLVDSYINGELNGSLLENFRSYYLASPTRQRKVLFARSLQEFAKAELAAGGVATPEVAPRALVGQRQKGKLAVFLESLATLSGGRPLFQFAAAAAVLVLVGVGVWILIRGLSERFGGNEVAKVANQNTVGPVNSQNVQVTPSPVVVASPADNGSTNKPEVPQSSPWPRPTPKPTNVEAPRPVIATVVLFPPLRGGQKLAQVPITPQTEAAAFTLNLESADYPTYKVELVDQGSGKSLWRTEGIRPRGSGKGGTTSLSVQVPAKLLRAQIYSFTVSGIGKTGEAENIGDYSFRVVR